MREGSELSIRIYWTYETAICNTNRVLLTTLSSCSRSAYSCTKPAAWERRGYINSQGTEYIVRVQIWSCITVDVVWTRLHLKNTCHDDNFALSQDQQKKNSRCKDSKPHPQGARPSLPTTHSMFYLEELKWLQIFFFRDLYAPMRGANWRSDDTETEWDKKQCATTALTQRESQCRKLLLVHVFHLYAAMLGR